MKILAIDSSAQTASVAITEDDKPLCEYSLHNGNTHSETLLPMVESALSLLSLKVDDIDLFSCSAGPGSFTGVKIGAATIKGLAFGKDKPCVGVSTLEALAQNLASFKGLICPVMNARRNQVYTALFESDGTNIKRIFEDSVMQISELDEILAQKDMPVRFCGDGYSITVDALKLSKYIDVPLSLQSQSAYSVAIIAKKMFDEGKYLSDRELVSTYLRPCQAERERNERLKKEKENSKK